MPCVNEIEGRVKEPSLGSDVMDFEDDVLWWSPRGDRSCIGIFKRAAMLCRPMPNTPISSPLNLTWGNSSAISTTLRRWHLRLAR